MEALAHKSQTSLASRVSLGWTHDIREILEKSFNEPVRVYKLVGQNLAPGQSTSKTIHGPGPDSDYSSIG